MNESLSFDLVSLRRGHISDGVEVKPYLTFQGEEEEIIHCGENSYTYEYVLGILNKFFDKKDTE